MNTADQKIAQPRGEMRIEAWDYLRLLAFVDIACLHLIGRHVLLGLGLPAFVMITCALALTSSSGTLMELTSVRVRRLFVPWTFWSLVLCVQIAYAQIKHGDRVLEGFEPAMVLYGGGQHLWFLPYAACAGLLVYWLHARLPREAAGVLTGALLVLALASGVLPKIWSDWRARRAGGNISRIT